MSKIPAFLPPQVKDQELTRAFLQIKELFALLSSGNGSASNSSSAVGFTQSVLLGQATAVFSAGVGSVDALAYTVPAAPTGNGRVILILAPVRIVGAMTGAGQVQLSCGTTAGAVDLMTAQVVNSGSPVGIAGGVDIATCGAAFTAANGYQVPLNPGQQVWIRAATTSGPVVGGSATVYVFGYALP